MVGTDAVADGARNACKHVYGAAWKAAKALGFRRIVTYTLPEEGGGYFARNRMAADVQWLAARLAPEQQHPKRAENEHSDNKVKDAMGGCDGIPSNGGPATSASARAGAWAGGF